MITIYRAGNFHAKPGQVIILRDNIEKEFSASNNSDEFNFNEEVRISTEINLKKGADKIKVIANSGTKNILHIDSGGALITGEGDDIINGYHSSYLDFFEYKPGIYVNGKIDMGDGNDIITGSPIVINGGASTISMGAGNDKISAPFTGESNGTIDFGAGEDELVLDDGTYTIKKIQTGVFSITQTGNNNFQNTIQNLERLANKQGKYIHIREGIVSTKDFDLTGELNPEPQPKLPSDGNIYRFYNRNKGTHFFTASNVERNNIISKPEWGYKYEGIAYRAPSSNATKLYRFYNSSKGYHFMTISKSEADFITGKPEWGYKYEGRSFGVSTQKTANASTEVHRFYHQEKGVHFYTANENEAENIITKSLGSNYSLHNAQGENNLLDNGWGYRYEGVAWYAAALNT